MTPLIPWRPLSLLLQLRLPPTLLPQTKIQLSPQTMRPTLKVVQTLPRPPQLLKRRTLPDPPAKQAQNPLRKRPGKRPQKRPQKQPQKRPQRRHQHRRRYAQGGKSSFPFHSGHFFNYTRTTGSCVSTNGGRSKETKSRMPHSMTIGTNSVLRRRRHVLFSPLVQPHLTSLYQLGI